MKYIIILCTIDNIENAKKISQLLVSEKFAACVNILPGLMSVYLWDDKVMQDSELLMIIKTKKALFEDVKTKITELHPYKVPEIISFDIADGASAYLDWIGASVK